MSKLLMGERNVLDCFSPHRSHALDGAVTLNGVLLLGGLECDRSKQAGDNHDQRWKIHCFPHLNLRLIPYAMLLCVYSFTARHS